MSTEKPSNPKDSVGIKKVPFSVIPANVIGELGLALLEGARKYGRHNWRVVGVRASVYFDAAMRHLTAFWEGQDIDPDSGLSHITKAIATLTVLRDAMLNNNWEDDRPPPLTEGWINDLNKKAAEVIERYPDAKAAHVKSNDQSSIDNSANIPVIIDDNLCIYPFNGDMVIENKYCFAYCGPELCNCDRNPK